MQVAKYRIVLTSDPNVYRWPTGYKLFPSLVVGSLTNPWRFLDESSLHDSAPHGLNPQCRGGFPKNRFPRSVWLKNISVILKLAPEEIPDHFSLHFLADYLVLDHGFPLLFISVVPDFKLQMVAVYDSCSTPFHPKFIVPRGNVEQPAWWGGGGEERDDKETTIFFSKLAAPQQLSHHLSGSKK